MSGPQVLVVGAGPAGLSAARDLAGLGHSVLVVEREAEAGGIPRHSEHQGFGLRDLHRSLTGPEYSRRLVRRALMAGADVRCSTTVTGLSEDGAQLVSPQGVELVRPSVVLLATGARERPRSARGIPGDRGAGTMTTGQLQQMVQAGLPVGTRAVVLGAEHVSYSAVLTLRHAGVRTVAMVTDLDRPQSFVGAAPAARFLLGVTLRTSTVVARVEGRRRVEAIVLRDVRTGREDRVEADLFVTTGDWIPDAELARRAGVALDAGTRGPRTSLDGQTGTADIFAAGNVVHPAETADRCALGGQDAARRIAAHLRSGQTGALTPLEPRPPLAWVWPNLVEPGRPPGRIVLRTTDPTRNAVIVAHQAGRTLGRGRLRGGGPNRHSSVRGSLLQGMRGGDPVVLELVQAQP